MPNSFPFDRIEICAGIELFREHRIERFGQPLSRSHPVDRRILHAVRNPDVGHAGGAERLPHRRADPAARRGMADPERPDALVAVRQREVVGRLRMREQRGVEVQSDPSDLAQSIHDEKCSGPIASRSTGRPPNSP
jgi:hypothetical protein